ncbi:hypothetical protein C4E22_04090 [ANME-1 cluster archaeon AG-394-G06]|nr:hypothetical protein [ANME-1 cluster archaeon AG-394-G06]
MKKGVKVLGLIAVLIVIGSLFTGIVSTEVIVADVNKDIAATNVNVTPTSPKGDLELVRGDDETDTSTKNKTERIKVTPIPISKPTLKPRPTPRPKPTPTSTHDMVVTNVNTTPSSPDLEQPTVIYVTVTNEGEQQEDNVSVKVYVDSAQIGSTQYISSAPGSSNTTTFLWSPTTAKTYSVKGEVEILNGEINVKDNTKSIKVWVSAVSTPTPTPTPTPTAIIDSITTDPAEQGTDTVFFTGHGTDPDGTVEAYNWSSSIDGQLSTSAAFTKQASELSVGTHAIYFKVQDDDGTWSSEDTEDLTIYPGPELSYSPESHEFGDMREGETDNTTFELWNSGTDTLTYSLRETCDWLEVHPTSGSSTGEHNSITVDMDTTGLFEGSHTGDITINSNDGSGTFTVMVNVMPCHCGNKGVNPTSWSTTLNCGESDSQIVTVSASDCIVNGVTVSKVSGPTWLSVSQTDLGDIASGSSETFTVTAAPPAGTSSGDYPYTIRVSNTCGSPSSRDVAGRIKVNENADGQTDYWAVIVGVADYTGTSYDLAYTDDDAIDMYNTLLLSGDYWQPDHIRLLLDSEADKAGILTAFNWLDDNEDPDDVVLFFFSGHGTYDIDDDGDELDGYDEFFCPYDFNNIRDDELDAELDRLGSTSIAVIMDTCFAGGMTRDSSVKTLPKQKVELTDGFAKDIQSTGRDMGDAGRVVLMACDDDEYSYEIYELENGLFSYYVIEGLQGCADAEGNGDNICSAEETFVYAEPRVLDIISTQHPQLYDGYTGELPITRPPCPELSYSPASHDFGDMCEGNTDSTTFELWNSRTGALTYFLSESCDWLEVHPTSGSSTGEHNTITVDMDTTGLSEGSHTCDISISSNGGSGTFTVTVNIVAATGSISVTSTPSGATIYLDGSYIGGQTPYTITNVPAGTHTLKLTLGGYYDWSSNVGVTAGETSYVYATLSPIPPQRTITFYTDPTAGGTITFDGSIYSNGQSTTKTDGTYSVSANPASNYEFNHWSTTDGMSVANLYSQSTTATVSGDGTIKAWFDYYIPCPELSYSPASHNFGDKCEGETDSATFELWNSGTGTLTYSLSESGGWLNVYPISGSSTGEHGTITVDIDTTGLSEGFHTCDITISSNGGSETFTVTVNVVPYPESLWTYMVYLDGDNNLEGAGIDDFLEMSSVGSTSDVNIVVQFDRIPGYDTSYGDWTGCKRFHVTYGMTPMPANALIDLGECNMGDPNTLSDFVDWAMTNFPADNYALILWNHGDGWRSINTWVPWAADIKDAKDAGLSRGICWDFTNGSDSLTLQETEVALTGKYVQLLGYDACLMHMIEVVYQVMANAGVSVGSEEVEPWDGWPYDTILADLTVTPTMNEDALGMVIVDRYMASYPTYNDLTQSAMDNSALPNLVAAVDNLAQALMTEINGGHVADVQEARNAAAEIYYNYYIDLYNFAEMVDTYVPGARTQAQAVMNSMGVAVYEEAHGLSVPNDHGLSIYYPRVEGDYLASYDNTAFAIDTQWNEFLKRYYEGPICEGTATSCGIYPNCENCNEDDGCYLYGNGCEERNYYCVSNDEGCDYTYSNRHTDEWIDTGNTRWIDDPENDCKEKKQKEQEYHDYTCSDGTCTYSVTDTQWIDTGDTQNKPEGTICGCTANNTLKTCYEGTCTDTGICNSTNCSADVACDGKEPGESCGPGRICNSTCKCVDKPECEGTNTSCGIYPNCENCTEKDGCYPYGDGCEERDYYCKSNEVGCDYTHSNRHTDGWKDTGKTRWVDDLENDCKEKKQKEQEYHDYTCSDGTCTGSVTDTQWIDTGDTQNKPDGTICGCTASNTLKTCKDSICTDTGICDSTTCGADAACDGKRPGDSCGGGICDSNCKCGGQAVGEDYGVFSGGLWFVDTTGDHAADDVFGYGFAGAAPLVGDIDQDGTDDIAIVGAYGGNYRWFVDTNGDHVADEEFWFGFEGAIPLVGDIDQDGTDDIAIVNAYGGNYMWFVDTNGDHVVDEEFWFGFEGAIPLVGDIDQDGTDDIAIVNAYGGNYMWFVDTNGDHVVDEEFWFGFEGAIPLVGDIDQDGTDDIAIVNAYGGNYMWFVDTNFDKTADQVFWFGFAGATPLVGDIG